jgi:hypothetical protein
MTKNKATNKLRERKKTTKNFISILLGSMNPHNELISYKGGSK